MTMMATSMSEHASETMKKFCTVLNGRKVNTERITRMLPQIQSTTMLERTSATGRACARAMACVEDEEVFSEEVTGGETRAILVSPDEIRYQSR